jgi:hypothetical protein
MVDLEKLREIARDEVEETQNRQASRENSKYPVVYTGENGKLTVRILYNVKAGLVQRKVIRHESSSKSKVPCLQVYGEDCLVCKKISEVEQIKGRECGAFRKYGYKVRGICYAKIVDHEATYFRDNNSPKKGDIILLMYPKTVYDDINKIIVDSGEHLSKIIVANEGIPVVIERTQKGKEFPSYKAYVYPYGAVKAFESDSEGTGDQKFEDMLNDIPDISESLMPKYPSEDVRTTNKALAETIHQEYMNGSVINPNDSDKDDNTSSSDIKEESTNIAQTSSNEIHGAGMPECFGNHVDNENKCLLCVYESECVASK